jgi:WD40 repeat protein
MTRRTWLAAACAGASALVGAARSADADTLLTVSMRHAIQSPADGPRQYPAVVSAIAIQPHGRWVAAAGDDHVIRIWNIDSGALITRLSGHRDWIRAVAFSPAGDRLVSSGNDRRVLLWDVPNGRLHSQIAELKHAVDAVAFSHGGQWVITAGFEDHLYLLDLHEGSREYAIPCACPDNRALAISSDDRHVAAGGRDGFIRIWDVTQRRWIRETRAHALRIRAIQFAQDDQQLISGGEDRSVRVWNWNTDDQAYALPMQPAKVLAMTACGPQLVATAGSDNIIRLWDLATRQELQQLTGHTGSVSALAFQDGYLVSGGFDTFLRIWQVPEHTAEGVRSAQRDSR